jgi:hypothetical protein
VTTMRVQAGKNTILAHVDRASAVDIVGELIWNAIDAEATRVDVTIEPLWVRSSVTVHAPASGAGSGRARARTPPMGDLTWEMSLQAERLVHPQRDGPEPHSELFPGGPELGRARGLLLGSGTGHNIPQHPATRGRTGSSVAVHPVVVRAPALHCRTHGDRRIRCHPAQSCAVDRVAWKTPVPGRAPWRAGCVPSSAAVSPSGLNVRRRTGRQVPR